MAEVDASRREALPEPVTRPARGEALIGFALKAIFSTGLIAHILHALVDNVDEIWRAISVIFQANVMLHFFLIAEALDFGVREQAFIVLFGTVGISVSSAALLAWIALAFVLVQVVAVGVVFARRRKAVYQPEGQPRIER